MDASVILEYLLGPAGTLVFALLFIFGLLSRRAFVPLWIYEKTEERTNLLDAENQELNEAVISLKEELAAVRAEVQYLRQEIKNLRGENA